MRTAVLVLLALCVSATVASRAKSHAMGADLVPQADTTSHEVEAIDDSSLTDSAALLLEVSAEPLDSLGEVVELEEPTAGGKDTASIISDVQERVQALAKAGASPKDQEGRQIQTLLNSIEAKINRDIDEAYQKYISAAGALQGISNKATDARKAAQEQVDKDNQRLNDLKNAEQSALDNFLRDTATNRRQYQDSVAQLKSQMDMLDTLRDTVGKLTGAVVNAAKRDWDSIFNRGPAHWGNRLVTAMTRYGPADGTDVGYIAGREMPFQKRSGTTRMRLLYNDNMRTYNGNGQSCRWEIRVDGAACPSGMIAGDNYINMAGLNTHRGRVLIGYCDGLSAGDHTLTVYVSSTPGYSGADCYTGWNTDSASWTLEAEEMPPGFANAITRYGPEDGGDNNYVSGRDVTITKKEDSTRLRLLYNDNLRVYGGNSACRWEIRVNGASCRSGKVAGDFYAMGNSNTHRQHVVMGYCDNVPKGNHRLQVYVGPVPGYEGTDCYTGWNTATASWTLEGQELSATQVTAVTKYGPEDSKDVGFVNGRTMPFHKIDAASLLRVTYSDSMRTQGAYVGCRWSLYIDGKACPSGNIATDNYSGRSTNIERRRILTGFCRNVPRGDHTLTVYVSATPGYSADCNTGWNTATTGWTLETEEIPVQSS